ncbi:MAG: SGNH/GDSL hydrolase family protein [Thermoanaerobaculia bacterium]
MIATLAFLIILAEGFARAKAILHPETQGFPTYSQELWLRKYVHLNSLGFRDKQRTAQTGHEVRRILIVGDSFAFGAGIQDPEGRFGEQLEERLGETHGRWEVINASRSDTHTLQHIEFLRSMLDFQPELVVLIYVFNDIDYLRQVTRLSALTGSILSVGRVLFLNSYLVQELYVRIRKIWLARASDDRYYPYDDIELLRKHLTDLRRFVSLAKENGAEVRIVPFSFQIEQSDRTRYSRFFQLAMDFELPICSLEGAFEGHSPGVLRVNSLDGHPSAYANGLAVEAALDCLASASP